jgi:hypothetical protein
MKHLTPGTGTAIWWMTEPDFSILFTILFTLVTFWRYLQHKIAYIIETPIGLDHQFVATLTG